MRGSGAETGSLFSYVGLAARVPKQHPLRVIRRLVDAALVDPSPAFAALYAPLGRPSIPPERLVRALPLQAFYSVRSGRQLMEQLGYNLLFRWSVGLGIGDPVWDVTTFTKNRERLLDGDTAREFLAALLNRPEVRALLSDEHFPVDGTPIQAWAGMKGFRPRDGSGAPPAPGAATASGTATAGSARTRPTPRPASPRPAVPQGAEQGGAAVLHEPRADGEPPRAGGRWPGERGQRHGRAGRGGGYGGGPARPASDHAGRRDKHFDTRGFVTGLRELNVTPYVARNTTNRRSAIDGRTTRHPGYQLSRRARKRIEEAFGWIKEVAPPRRVRHRGKARIGRAFTLAAAAYDLIRLPKLLGAAA